MEQARFAATAEASVGGRGQRALGECRAPRAGDPRGLRASRSCCTSAVTRDADADADADAERRKLLKLQKSWRTRAGARLKSKVNTEQQSVEGKFSSDGFAHGLCRGLGVGETPTGGFRSPQIQQPRGKAPGLRR